MLSDVFYRYNSKLSLIVLRHIKYQEKILVLLCEIEFFIMTIFLEIFL